HTHTHTQKELQQNASPKCRRLIHLTVGRLYIKRKEKVKVKHDAQQIIQHNRKREKKNEHVQIQITVNDATERKENSPYRGNKVLPC
uniref:Uncharacterized protein n=1 Tax=Anopheles arabiensis TaxID=7173 RepID=A0A182IH00_ANOAR